MLQYIWVTIRYSEILSSPPNLPSRRTRPIPYTAKFEAQTTHS